MSDVKHLLVTVVSPNGLVYQHRSIGVHAEAVDGGITILPRHLPIMVPLKIGELRVKRLPDDAGQKREDYIAVAGGVLELHGNELTILANVAERARDIDIERALKAKEIIEQRLQEIPEQDKTEVNRLNISLRKAINRIGVSSKGQKD